MYEIFEQLLQRYGITAYKFCKETGISQSTISTWKQKRNLISPEIGKKVADYFGITLDFLMTGTEEPKEKAPELTLKDERDIAKDLDRIMGEIRKGDDEPLYYNGVEIDEASLSLLENAIEYALRETKKENKIKYNPHKNKK